MRRESLANTMFDLPKLMNGYMLKSMGQGSKVTELTDQRKTRSGNQTERERETETEREKIIFILVAMG